MNVTMAILDAIKEGPITTVAAGTEPIARRLPGRPRDQTVYRRIMDATLLMLGQVGYQRLTVEGVAVLAGAGKSSIYRYWANAGELAAEALVNQVSLAESQEMLALVSRELRAGGQRAMVAEAAVELVRRER